MKYPNIKAAKLSHSDIAKAFGFKNVKSFRTSSAHKRYMQGIEEILTIVHDQNKLLSEMSNSEIKKLQLKDISVKLVMEDGKVSRPFNAKIMKH